MRKTFYRKGNDFEKQIYKKYANLLTRVKYLSKRLYFQYKFHKNRNNEFVKNSIYTLSLAD